MKALSLEDEGWVRVSRTTGPGARLRRAPPHPYPWSRFGDCPGDSHSAPRPTGERERRYAPSPAKAGEDSWSGACACFDFAQHERAVGRPPEATGFKDSYFAGGSADAGSTNFDAHSRSFATASDASR